MPVLSVDDVLLSTGRVPHESVGPLLHRLARNHVRLEPLHVVRGDPEDPEAVLLVPVHGGREASPIIPDLLVWHAPRLPEVSLVAAAGALAGDRLSAIGDCVTPRRIGHAIAEGYRVGASI
jgi:2,4-dienoyl-CoA reductase (NADPH2)